MNPFGFNLPLPGQEVFHPRPGTILDFNTMLIRDIPADWPSQVEENSENVTDLSGFFIKNLKDTFFVRARGDAMVGARIKDGGILIVDRSITPENGKVVVAFLDGELIIRRLRIYNGFSQLEAENANYPITPISDESGPEIWGVVTGTMHSVDDVDPMFHLFGKGGRK